MFKPDYLVVAAVLIIAVLAVFVVTSFADDEEELVPEDQVYPEDLRAQCEEANGCYIENASLYYGDVLYDAGGNTVGKVTPNEVCILREGYTVRPSTNKVILECPIGGNLTKFEGE